MRYFKFIALDNVPNNNGEHFIVEEYEHAFRAKLQDPYFRGHGTNPHEAALALATSLEHMAAKIREHAPPAFELALAPGAKEEESPYDKDVHTEHCCEEHRRCKYGYDGSQNYDGKTCSVASGEKRASFPCNCDWM